MPATQPSNSAELKGLVVPPIFVQPIQFVPETEPGQSQNPAASRWSARDDVLLCDALIVQKKMNRTRDTGVFTLEAWNAVAEQMKGSERISGGAQKSVAQCKARWQRLKIEYRVVKRLRQQPGFTWNEDIQIVTALAATWDAYVAEYHDAQSWRKKTFPAYDRVAFLNEDDHGREAGEKGFKCRWNASARHIYGNGVALDGTEGQLPSTSVFSLASTVEATPAMPQDASGVVMTMPPNGRSSTNHQYRLFPLQSDGGRSWSLIDDRQTASSKRRNRGSSSIIATSPPILQSETCTGPCLIQAQINPTELTSYIAPALRAPQPTSASPLALAIQFMENTEGLADAEFVKAVQLFRRRMEVVEAYLAIQNKRARSMYLQAELEDFSRS